MTGGPFGSGPMRWRGVARVLPFIVLIAMGVGYTNFVQREADRRHDQLVRESERKWCAIINALVAEPAPTTERGRVIAEAFAKLRRDLGCG